MQKTIDEQETFLTDYEYFLGQLRHASKEESLSILDNFRTSTDPYEFVRLFNDVSDPNDSRKESSSTPKGSDDEPSIKDAASTTSRNPSVRKGEIYDSDNLPPEAIVQAGMAAYFDNSYRLFYAMPKKEADANFEAVYESKFFDVGILCELCALGALGCAYTCTTIPFDVMESMYQTACAYVIDCVENCGLRGMKVYVCLAIYCFMTKRKSARLHIGMLSSRSERVQD